MGCSNGDIAVFQMAANSNARLQRTVKCHEAPISTMTGGGDLVASGDDDGQVSGRSAGRTFERKFF